MGLLRVKGTIDISQFWPTGESPNILSDADTVHVQVDPKTAFVFEGNVTRAFDYAWITTRKNKNGTRSPEYVIVGQAKLGAHIKVRLQGIDAPELHYNVDKKKPEVRQNWGKRAALELRTFLKSHTSGTQIDCHVETIVKSPNDAFDMYGRFVGDIIIGTGAGIENVNHWLVRHGWAFPTYYNSMQIGEIDAINTLWAKSKAKDGFINSMINRASDDMYGMAAGKAGDAPAQGKTDKGKVVLPKMFRRLVGFKENSKGAASLDAFLGLPSKKRDLVINLADFKKLTPAQRARPTKRAGVPLTDLHTLVTAGNRLDAKPETLVFVEQAAQLKNSTGRVTGWDERGQPVSNI